MADERVAIFIDGSNFYHAIRNTYAIPVNFEHLVRFLSSGRRLLRTYYYITSVPEDKDRDEARKQQKFLNYLRSVPYFEIRYGRLERRLSECRGCKQKFEYWTEKGVDVALAVDMVRMAYSPQNSYDTAILVSGDGDFSIAVKTIKDVGKNVECAYVNRKWALQLSGECDKFIEITKEALMRAEE